jgi:soluble lytic murein transglycosylase-like protein
MCKILQTIAVLAFWLAGTTVALADIYGYTDESGAVHLSDSPLDERFELLLASPVEITQPNPGLADSAPKAIAPIVTAQAGLPYHEIIRTAAESNHLDSALLHAVILAESNYNVNAISPKGATGIMQLMPQTARRFGVTNIFDPKQNIDAGAQYLGYLLKMFGNDMRLAVAAYNAGEGSILQHNGKIPPYRETNEYVRKVLATYKRFSS